MTSGTNWTGGRGHVKKAKRASGLKILEHGSNTEQHFAKLRAIRCNIIVQDQPNSDANSKTTPLISLTRTQPDSRGLVPVHAAAGLDDELIHSSTPSLPRVINRPNKPTKQNRLPELMENAVRNIESLDAKRAHINSMDARSLAGLDIVSRKRKYGIALDSLGQVASKPFYYPTEAKPRAFVASLSPEPPIVVDTCAEHVEEMLSFGTPSDRHSANGSQTSTICSNGEMRDEHMGDLTQVTTDALPVSTSPAGSESSTKGTDIPPTLYEDAFRVAAQTLKLQDALLGVQTNTSLTPWDAQPSEDDSEIRAFNLFTPTAPDGISPEPESRVVIAFQEERNPNNRLSNTPGKENRLDIGNQARSGLRQDLQDHNWRVESNKASGIPVHPREGPRMETPKGTKSPAAPRKPAGKIRSISGSGSMPPSPLDRYVLRSHPSHSRRISDQVRLPSDHSNVHGKLGDGGSSVIAKSPPKLDSSYTALDFASVESSPRPSQEIGVSLTTGDGHNRTIGLQLFDDHPRADMEANA